MSKKKKKHFQRKIKFLVISKVLLPMFVLFYKLWTKTLRYDMSCLPELKEMFSHQRIVYAVYHGNSPALLAWSKRLKKHARESVILTSPSRDGQLIDNVITAFGHRFVKGSSSSGGKAGTLAMINEVKKGYMGMLTVDGPRGPLAVPKPGVITIARHSNAVLFTVVISASHFIQFGSWDKLFLPLPFSKTSVKVRAFDLSDESEPREITIHRLQTQMWEDAQELQCPIVKGMERPELLNKESDQ